MHRTAKSLELVEVEVYGCCILCPYLFLHKRLILCNVIYNTISLSIYFISSAFIIMLIFKTLAIINSSKSVTVLLLFSMFLITCDEISIPSNCNFIAKSSTDKLNFFLKSCINLPEIFFSLLK